MRLLAHNMLICQVRGCVSTGRNFPLNIEVTSTEDTNAEFNRAFLTAILPKLQWNALLAAATQVPHRAHTYAQ
jgi:multifunctional methyltransferase subunit TRM112